LDGRLTKRKGFKEVARGCLADNEIGTRLAELIGALSGGSRREQGFGSQTIRIEKVDVREGGRRYGASISGAHRRIKSANFADLVSDLKRLRSAPRAASRPIAAECKQAAYLKRQREVRYPGRLWDLNLIEVSRETGLSHEVADTLIQGAGERPIRAGAIDAALSIM
jgi:hypothetical protein